MREAKASIVHGYHPARFEIKKSASRIGGIGVNVAKLRRVVSADGQQRQLRRKAFANLAEASEISRISRVIHRVLPRLQNVPAVAAMRIFQDSRAPVARRHMRDRDVSERNAVPPFA